MGQIAKRSLAALILLCGAPASATDYGEPLTPQQEDFKARFLARDEICRKESMEKFGLSEARAEAFCACEIDVIARHSSLKDLASFTKAAIGTEQERAENTARAQYLLEQLLPERKRVCGY
jgi:hypothetical protein